MPTETLRLPAADAPVECWQALVDRLQSPEFMRVVQHGRRAYFYELASGQLVPLIAGSSVSATWTDPTSATLDLLTGQTSSQTWTEAIASNFDYLLGTDGKTPTAGLVVRQADTLLNATTASVTFSSIGSGFKDLVLEASGRTDRASNANDVLLLQFNSDTGSNYSAYAVVNNAGSVSASNNGGVGGVEIGGFAAATATASGAGGLTIHLQDYASTTFLKCGDFFGGIAITSAFVGAGGFFWNSTSAINTIKLLPLNGSNFIAGTRFTLHAKN